MSQRDIDFEQSLPLELKIRVLQAELDRLESDFRWLRERKLELQKQIHRCEEELSKTRRRQALRRVK